MLHPSASRISCTIPIMQSSFALPSVAERIKIKKHMLVQHTGGDAISSTGGVTWRC